MKSLSLSQAASILALAMIASIVPACGGGSPGAMKATAFQQAPAGPTVHEAFHPSMIIVPGATAPTAVDVKTWVFTPAPGEVVLKICVSGEYLHVPTGGTPSMPPTLSASANVGTDVGASEVLNLSTANTGIWLNFCCDFSTSLNWNGQAVKTMAGPINIKLGMYYDDWSGDFRNVKLQVFTTTFTPVANSPSIQ